MISGCRVASLYLFIFDFERCTRRGRVWLLRFEGAVGWTMETSMRYVFSLMWKLISKRRCWLRRGSAHAMVLIIIGSKVGVRFATFSQWWMTFATLSWLAKGEIRWQERGWAGARCARGHPQCQVRYFYPPGWRRPLRREYRGVFRPTGLRDLPCSTRGFWEYSTWKRLLKALVADAPKDENFEMTGMKITSLCCAKASK